MPAIRTKLHNYSSTSTNMVSVVENAINGYKMGPIRALAQEPVQNSKDAKLDQCVDVQYRLHARGDSAADYVLTVTDRGTKGLGGPMLKEAEIASRGRVLNDGEDWAAFEGHGYTKTNQDALGSRGQGKSAFLYHSEAYGTDMTLSNIRRMVMLYDTLLPDSQYRLGVRYANPNDVVQDPPFVDGEARELVTSAIFDVDDDLSVPLRLEPLGVVGTRVIVPCLSTDAIDAIRNRRLEKWLQMCWWRAIQVGDIRITVVDDAGNSRVITVPSWWKDEPWRDCCDDSAVEYTNIVLRSYQEFKIKRVVLLHDEDLEAQEHLYSNKEPEFDGVQLLRGTQWIETLGIQQEFAALIPEEFRAGFRGFAEFDRALDRELRNTDYEKPQHDDFIRTQGLVREIIAAVKECVKQFSERQGWTDSSDSQREALDREVRVADEIFSTFAQPKNGNPIIGGGNGAGGTKWDGSLQVDYPDEQTTRVDWGQTLSAVYVSCQTDPPMDYGHVKIDLELENTLGAKSVLASERTDLKEDGTASVDFGDFPVLKGRSNNPHLHCPEDGRYLMSATISSGRANVKRVSRRLFVQTDPPKPSPKQPITAYIRVTNLDDPERTRINTGECFAIEISAKNRNTSISDVLVDASLVARELPGNLFESVDAPKSAVLASRMPVQLPINRAGESPMPITIVNKTFRMFDDLPDAEPEMPYLVAAPGPHDIRVDLRDANSGEPITSRSTVIYFEHDPPRKGTQIPFVLKRKEESQNGLPSPADPSWWIEKPRDPAEPLYLYYSARHHLYQVAKHADRGSGRRRRGTTSFIREICADALVDWMHEGYINGDETRYDLITDRRLDSHLWSHLADSTESYRDAAEEDTPPDELAKLRREVVAKMVRILDKGGV